MDKKDHFNNFLTKNIPEVRSLLKRALPFVTTEKNALDIGAGMLYDTRFLLEKGFSVVSVDPSELTAIEANKINSEKLTIFNDIVEHYTFPENYFDLVSAQFSLMYVQAKSFSVVFDNITKSLVAGGIFAGQLFGTETDMPWLSVSTLYHTREEINELLGGQYDVIFIKEFNGEVESVDGIKGFSQDFRIVAKKK
jgi:ubiquinone/menaquinone biosynthesis C-methylase UbiE